MNGLRLVMWVLVCTMTIVGCIEPMESVPGSGGSDMRVDAHYLMTLQSRPPPVVYLSSTTAVGSLWSGTRTARKYVLMVAYTLPRDATGATPPPRFRAFGLDMSTESYVFTIDGERAAFLGSFTESMLAQDAIVITTPPGCSFPGSEQGSGTDGGTGGVDGGGGGGSNPLQGTEPVIRVPVNGETGDDEWGGFDFDWLKSIPRGTDSAIPDFVLPGGAPPPPPPPPRR